MTTWAWVHRANEHEVGGIVNGKPRSADRNMSVLERLAEYLQNVPGEFSQLIEEQDAVVCQRDFAGSRNTATPDECCVGDGMMG